MSDKSRFIKGTMILFCANACSKIIGAIYKIPLTYILKEDGMAVYHTAFTVYMMFLTFVTSGFPFAATKLLAEDIAIGKTERIRPVVNSVGIILVIFGAVLSLIIFVMAEYLAISMREINAAGAIRAISLSVLFVSAGGVIKAYNEASSDHIPTAVSQVFEAAIKLFLGLSLAYKLAHISVFKSAEGAISAVTIGELCATTLLMAVWRIKVRKLPSGYASSCEIKQLFSIAVPLMLTSVAASLLSMTEVSAIRRALSALTFDERSASSFLSHYSMYSDTFENLLSEKRFTPDGIRMIFGAYSGYAQTIFNLPAGIIATATAAATPMFASSLLNKKNLQRTTERVLSLVIALSLPSATVIFLYSDELLYLLFKNHFSSDMLRALSPSLVFLCVNNMFIALLHLSGRIYEPFLGISLGMTARIFLSSLLIRIPSINILGTGIAAVISSIILFFFLLLQVKKHLNSAPRFFKCCFAPFAASSIMVGIMHPAKAYLYQYTSSDLSFVISLLIGAVTYIFALTLLYNISKKDAVL